MFSTRTCHQSHCSLPSCGHSQEIRTTNAAEAFHRHLNENFASKHPNIFTFTEVITREQAMTILKSKNLDKAAHKPKEAKKCERRSRLHQSGEKTRLEYLEAMAHTCPPYGGLDSDLWTTTPLEPLGSEHDVTELVLRYSL
ncbi:autophagy-related protein 2 [Elysia marginata]|uniref:Autophagy-related protein 2 n=1 Tax=Elysia marginata TaxID=1093978 RepID=A0AAV4IUG9_9GAST|nr:autophagy-related protein 2 [Elysia marginata]